MSEDVIHIKLERDEATETKKDLLISKKELLQITRTIKSYNSMRSEELGLKLKLLKKSRSLKRDLTKLQRTLPVFTIPEIIKKSRAPEIEKRIEQVKEAQYDDDLEMQLQDIQDELNRLQQ